MAHGDSFWKLEQLSDAQLLESLSGVLRTQHRTLAALVAHLGEVEERRLHLEAAHGSMFAYCVARLGMSEDEACRRIELARLARKFPALFAELASGQMTLSVALVLKPALSPGNHLELLRAARGKSIRQARELVAERFPKPDAPSSIRKLPEQRPPSETAATGSRLPTSADCPLLRSPEATTLAGPATPPSLSPTAPPVASPRSVGLPGAAPSVASLPSASLPGDASPATVPPRLTPPPVAEPSAPPVPASPSAAPPAQPPAPTFALAAPPPRDGSAAVARNVVEPLSAGRYRIQFTADAALKLQLERARDLLRHTYPSGDFAPIVSRALDLLIDDLMRRASAPEHAPRSLPQRRRKRRGRPPPCRRRPLPRAYPTRRTPMICPPRRRRRAIPRTSLAPHAARCSNAMSSAAAGSLPTAHAAAARLGWNSTTASPLAKAAMQSPTTCACFAGLTISSRPSRPMGASTSSARRGYDRGSDKEGCNQRTHPRSAITARALRRCARAARGAFLRSEGPPGKTNFPRSERPPRRASSLAAKPPPRRPCFAGSVSMDRRAVPPPR